MTTAIIQPLHVATMTEAETYHYGELCAEYAAAGLPAPVDWDGYINDDDVTARIQGAAAMPNPVRSAAIQTAAEMAGLAA